MKIVLIADRTPSHFNSSDHANTLEMVENPYFDYIYETLGRLFGDVVHYDTPAQFIDNVPTHKGDVIFPLYSGVASRSRKALVPSICEAYDLAYIGGDPYTQVLCQDKYLTHQFVARFGLQTPRSALIESGDNLQLLQTLTPPLVIKPNFEGGSIGITEGNLVGSLTEALKLTTQLLLTYKQPIIAEEFCSGKEISILLIGDAAKSYLCEVTQIRCYRGEIEVSLTDRLFSNDLKKLDPNIAVKEDVITDCIPSSVLRMGRRLFSSLAKVDLLRIDGRLNGETFYCIELSPDAYLGPDSSFEIAYHATGRTFPDLLQDLVELAKKKRVDQNANAR